MFFVLLLIVCTMLGILLLVGNLPTASPLVDLDSPLNMIMLRAPQQTYTDQLINIWVSKTWRHDGSRIPCRLEKYQVASSPYLIIYTHGSTENLLDCTQFMREGAQSLRTDMLAWEFSGFGLNDAEKFERTAEGMNLSLQTVMAYALDTLGYKRILLWGHALGTGPALHVASERLEHVSGVICFAAFTSILDVVRDWTHPKIADLFEERWDNRLTIAKVSCPVLLLHGKNDTTISAHHSEELKRSLPSADLILLAKTGHTSFDWAEVLLHVSQWRTKHKLE
jgi:pimeloyl-ACP methyl ester carboxylesterase